MAGKLSRLRPVYLVSAMKTTQRRTHLHVFYYSPHRASKLNVDFLVRVSPVLILYTIKHRGVLGVANHPVVLRELIERVADELFSEGFAFLHFESVGQLKRIWY